MMMLTQAGDAMQGQVSAEDRVIESVEIDTRRMQPGALYFAIHGENSNGHRYIPQALEQGAVAVVVDQVFPDAESVPHIRVKDTTLALGDLARWWRTRFSVPVVGVTGSNGKTTVCGILHTLFKQALPGVAPQGSFNNHWGVPLTLLRLRDQHHSAIVEMGMNHPGELSYLGSIVKPTIGLITNAAAAHLEGLESVAGVARAKGELLEQVDPGGTVVLNRDDPYFDQWRDRAGTREVVSFGIDQRADIRLLETGLDLSLEIEGSREDFEFPLLGAHNRLNAAAAIAVARIAGLDRDQVSAALPQVAAVSRRLQPRRLTRDFLLIDDSYNANPASMRAAIDVLAEQPGRRVLVLGAMGELGEDSARIHEQVAHYASERGIDSLLTLVDQTDAGYLNDMAAYLRGFGRAARAFSDIAQLLAALVNQDRPLSLLVKGSRFAAMDRVVDALVSREARR